MGDEECCWTCGQFAGKHPPAETETDRPMAGRRFKILVAEKGDAPREYVPDKPVITIGRVQGNDVVLPKGNVSKRASQIVFKDDRVIVVDLKSSCGTYVNGRKITAPTVLREGAKIYIGDFLLTVVET